MGVGWVWREGQAGGAGISSNDSVQAKRVWIVLGNAGGQVCGEAGLTFN